MNQQNKLAKLSSSDKEKNIIRYLKMSLNLILVHIGTTVPSYIYECIFQTLLINKYNVKIYVVLNDENVDQAQQHIESFNTVFFEHNFHPMTVINLIPKSVLDNYLENNVSFKKYQQTLESKFQVQSFRDGFWVSTTSRFFYLQATIEVLHLKECFHIENDIIMYEPFHNIYDTIKFKDTLCMVKDAPTRVVPSLLYIPHLESMQKLTAHIADVLSRSKTFVNDMDILGSYKDTDYFNINLKKDQLIFDGAAIGQYLGGVDIRNLNIDPQLFDIHRFCPKTGFINETSVFKPNTCMFDKRKVVFDGLSVPLKVFSARDINYTTLSNISNLHIHSKQLYQFSSVFDTGFDEIITGDRVVSLCDYTILTRDILDFHKGIQSFAKDYIIVNDFKTANIIKLNEYFKNTAIKNKTNTIKIFVYTHILQDFIDYILDHLSQDLFYVFYLHNSDHVFDTQYSKLVENKSVKAIYAQNVNYPQKTANQPDCCKIRVLPIGIANSMWQHGDLIKVYTVMTETYTTNKTKSIYININPSTFDYRKHVLNAVNKKGTFEIASGKPYIEYLRELAKHRFCLCVRGNGIDTHRFWESLYLGVIPVIINNKTTNCQEFVNYLRNEKIPFVDITEGNLDKAFEKYNESYFSDELYKSFIKRTGSSLYSADYLKLSSYTG